MKLLVVASLVFTIASVQATTWQVGPTRLYTTCSAVASLVQDGDVVEIDAATYSNHDQVLWTKSNLVLRGIGATKPRLEAGALLAGNLTNGKAIFVISGHNVEVDNIEFANAKVIDNNGAGIRQEGHNLYAHHCNFVANEMGILCGSIANCTVRVEHCSFASNGSTNNPGYQHNIYINHIDSFIFRYNSSIDAIAEGHELKSRASYNEIMYNRIANRTSVDSRTIDLPNGGIAILVGNYIEQGINSANSNIIGYGLEGLTNASPHRLYLASNTMVNNATNGSFIDISQGADSLVLLNNIFAGPKPAGLILGSSSGLDSSHNLVATIIADCGFTNAVSFDYTLTATSPARDHGFATSRFAFGISLDPIFEYKDVNTTDNRVQFGSNIDIGASEFMLLGLAEKPGSRLIVRYVADRILEIEASPHTVKLYNMQGGELAVVNTQHGPNLQIDLRAVPLSAYILMLDGKFVRINP
jgi:hypothetical protein